MKDQCHQDCGPVFVSVATYHSIVCSLRTRQCAERVVVGGGGISESTTVNKQGEGWGRERVRRDAWKCYL